jgi:hypothetical protein
MVQIGNADQVLALVRAQLERMARSKRAGAAGKSASSELTPSSNESRLQAIGMLSDLPDEEFERVLVRTLLVQEFGEKLANQPNFQAIVDRTIAVLRDDPGTAKLMSDAGNLVRAGA